MTIFSEEPHSRQMERLMTAVPNFKPRGVGFRFAETQITVITASMPEILTAAMRQQYQDHLAAQRTARTAEETAIRALARLRALAHF